MRLSTAKKLLLLTLSLVFFLVDSSAENKKKKASEYQKPNIIKMAWGDLTTRNNYYFNASELFKEIVHNYEFQRQLDYNELLPFYFHDGADFSGNTTELETIARKTGIVLQLHDYSRWRDNAFLLLGKSQFLRKQYDTSLITFQYIVTTMKPGKMNMKVEFSNKDRLKYIRKRQKELAKKAGEKKKFIEIKFKKDQEEAQQKAETAREKQLAAIKQKQKQLEEIIKAKKKIIALQKKGKKIPPELLAKAKAKTTKVDSATIQQVQPIKKTQKPNYATNLPYILLGDQYVKNPYYKDSTGDRANQRPLDSLSKKAEEKFDKLSFWEKIKHKPSRPEAIVWMAKSLIELENYADAKSMISYGKALRKLTKKQRREFYLIDAYYHIRREDYSPAIEEIENALLYFKKKKDKAYYEYILAQLYSKNNQPADAVDYFVKAGKHTKTEEMTLFSQMQLANLYSKNPDLADQDVVNMLSKLIRFGKNREHADEVFYTMANYFYFQKDTTNAVVFLQKSVNKSIANPNQKGKSFLRLGEIAYDREDYVVAAGFYDSAIAYLPVGYENYDQIQSRKKTLSELAIYVQVIKEQDSLQRLGKLSPKELDKFLSDVKSKQEKEERKKSRFTSEGGANTIQQTGLVSANVISNGLWYFYNLETKSKGFNEFVSIWGDRKLEANWRRSNKSGFTDDFNAPAINTIDTSSIPASKGIKRLVPLKTATDSLSIPKTPEAFMASDKKIANALFGIGEIFKNKLGNLSKAKQAFDDLIRRYPNSEFDVKAHYYEYLIYLDLNLVGLAQKEKQYILENYPISEVAEVLNKNGVKDPSTASSTRAQILYDSTYQLFLSGNCDQVIINKKFAKMKYPAAAELANFEFLEAVCYGKNKQFDLYKKALSEIITKYPSGAIRQKALDYLSAYLDFQGKPSDTLAQKVSIPKDTVTIIRDSLADEFIVDTTNLWVLVQLKDKYIRVSDVVEQVKVFNQKNFSDLKLKINPVFFEGYAVLTIKRFEGITDAREYYVKIRNVSSSLAGENNSKNIAYYILAPSNFRKIKKLDDFGAYTKFFEQNYPK